MTAPEESRAVRQLRHDVDDVYELLDTTNQAVTAVAATQRRHTNRLEEVQQALDLQTGRLDRLEDGQRQQTDRLERIEDTQRQILTLLQGRPGDPPQT